MKAFRFSISEHFNYILIALKLKFVDKIEHEIAWCDATTHYQGAITFNDDQAQPNSLALHKTCIGKAIISQIELYVR